MTRHQIFEDLHQQGCFVMPNPWDLGSAKMMASLGAKALATSSAAHAFAIGLPDMGRVTRDQALTHAAEIVAATPLPVNGDLENGYGEAPETVAETIRLAAEAGLSGCSIEDTTMDDAIVYDFDLAVERVRAAADAARGLGQPFIFTARADGVMLGAYDMNEAIRRCQAFEAAGADMVYVPAPPSLSDISQLVNSVSIPVNVLAAGKMTAHSQTEIAATGARRISLGSAIARATHRVINDTVTAMLTDGDFSCLQKSISGDTVDS
ncbi:MAG: isocitrate lyase/phosphoenolpyruvate mutase family protein, partial [Rhodobacteraceae bacterium]|nr:isocitrate lyase/phosphoenolpyruvate mutase family protein [Paracoccaceae bacterium]